MSVLTHVVPEDNLTMLEPKPHCWREPTSTGWGEKLFQKQHIAFPKQGRQANEVDILFEGSLVFLKGFVLNKKACKRTGLFFQ